MNAELMAIDRSLDMAWNAGFYSLIYESDSQSALLLLENDHPLTHPYTPLISHRNSYLTIEILVSLILFVKGMPVLLQSCPTQLYSTLLADAMGVSFLRI